MKYPLAFIEQYIRGREITVGLVGKGAAVTMLPIMELSPRNEFYDYDAKYTKGKTDFEIPAKIGKPAEEQIRRYTAKAFREMHLSGVVRFDAILDGDEKPYFLEANTIPGMTETSDIPAMVKAAGMTFDDIVAMILDCVNI
jgi:D-alanine-D-alanine ligase